MASLLQPWLRFNAGAGGTCRGHKESLVVWLSLILHIDSEHLKGQRVGALQQQSSWATGHGDLQGIL